MHDSSLIARAQAGDAAAFAALIDRHALRAYRIAYIVAGNHHDAEDAVQEGCLVAFRTRGSLRSHGSFAGGFSQIVANRARDIVRSQRARRERDQRLADPEPTGPAAGLKEAGDWRAQAEGLRP